MPARDGSSGSPTGWRNGRRTGRAGRTPALPPAARVRATLSGLRASNSEHSRRAAGAGQARRQSGAEAPRRRNPAPHGLWVAAAGEFAYGAIAGIEVKADAGLKLSPRTLINPAALLGENSSVPRRLAVTGAKVARLKAVWPLLGTWMVCVFRIVPVSSLMVKFTDPLPTYPSATPVENPLVLSNHRTYEEPRPKPCKGTTACCCCCAVTLSVKTAKPVTSPSLNSWAHPDTSGPFKPAVWINPAAPATTAPVNDAVVWSGDPCGKVSGNGKGLPLSSRKTSSKFAVAVPVLSNVKAVVHWFPPEARCGMVPTTLMPFEEKAPGNWPVSDPFQARKARFWLGCAVESPCTWGAMVNSAPGGGVPAKPEPNRSEEHTAELQSLRPL